MSRGRRRVVAACLALAGCDSVLRLDDIHTIAPSPRALVFDNSSSAIDLVDFPVLIALDPTKIAYPQVVDLQHDLRFHDEATDTDLPFEIEHWDPTGESDLWVKIPVIHAGTTTERVLMFYGPNTRGNSAPDQVWTGYDLVFHGDAMVDSTGHSTPIARATTGAEPVPAPGAIGNAIQFDGGDGQVVEMVGSEALLAGWNQFTLELWVRLDYTPDPYNLGMTGSYANEPSIIDKPLGAVQGGRLRNSTPDVASPFILQTDFFWNNSTPLQGEYFYVPNQAWSQITYAYDGQRLWPYRDGTILDFDINDAPVSTSTDTTNTLLLGGYGQGVIGEIDEVRVSRTYRDVNWVFAQYLAMTRHFVTFRDP
ncbi:MAG: DUF2341 domain-containing protein [Acidobacteriota bacterium]